MDEEEDLFGTLSLKSLTENEAKTTCWTANLLSSRRRWFIKLNLTCERTWWGWMNRVPGQEFFFSFFFPDVWLVTKLPHPDTRRQNGCLSPFPTRMPQPETIGRTLHPFKDCGRYPRYQSDAWIASFFHVTLDQIHRGTHTLITVTLQKCKLMLDYVTGEFCPVSPLK